MASQTISRMLMTGALAAGLLLVPAARGEDDEQAARQAAARDAKAVGWLLRQGLQAILPIAEPPVDRQRQQQIEQRARQMERFFKPILESELELARRTCGGLDPKARRTIVSSGTKAVEEAARQVAARQFGGRADAAFDPRDIIRSRLAESLATVAAPEELAAYRLEVERRTARRDESERLLLVARLDRQLDLTAAQQRAIGGALEKAWEDDWGRVVREHGTRRINSYPLAPDYASAVITPHLEPDQVTDWENWCRAAGSNMAGNHTSWHFDGQGLQQPDPWWGQ